MTEENQTASTQPITKVDIPLGPPIAGRAMEMALIRKRLESVATTKAGRLLAFSGVSGLGKTRLLREAEALAKRRGFSTAFVGCRGSGQARGMPVRTLLHDLLDLQTRNLHQATKALSLNEAHNQLSEILLGDTSPRNAVGVANLILRVLEKGSPTLLCVDDLDEADDETAATLLKVANSIDENAALMIVGYVTQPPRWKSTLNEALTLDPLTPDDIKQFAPPAAKPTFLNSLAKQTDGNPLLLRLAIAAADKDPDEAPAPQKAVKEQFKGMSPAAGSILTAVAVLGDGASLGYAVRSGMVKGDTPKAVADTLVKEGWLTAIPHSDRLAFTNTLIRNALVSSMPTDIRKKYHQRAGDYFHETSLSGSRLHTREAVHHYEKAGNTTQALAALDLAVQDAQRRGDRQTVIGLYEQALTITRSYDDVSASTRSGYAESLGDIHAKAKDYEQAATAYTKADLEHSSLTLRGKLGLCLLTKDGVRAAHILKQVAGRVPLTYPDDFRWHLETGLAWAYTLSDNHYEAVRACRDALGRLGQMTGYGHAKTLVRTVLGTVMMYQGERAEAQGHLEAALLSWQARDDKAGLELITLAQRSAPRPSLTHALLTICLMPHLG